MIEWILLALVLGFFSGASYALWSVERVLGALSGTNPKS
jgi:hypothetical protein